MWKGLYEYLNESIVMIKYNNHVGVSKLACIYKHISCLESSSKRFQGNQYFENTVYQIFIIEELFDMSCIASSDVRESPAYLLFNVFHIFYNQFLKGL